MTRQLKHLLSTTCLVASLALGLGGVSSSVRAQTIPTEFSSEPSITIEEAVRRALEKNYAIAVARYSEPIAAAGVSIARGAFEPQLGFSYSSSHAEAARWDDPIKGARLPGTITKSDSYEASLGGALPWGTSYTLSGISENIRDTTTNYTDSYGTSASLTLRQPLLRGFLRGGGITALRIAKVDRTMSSWDFNAVVVDTITRVVFACNELHYAQARLRSALRSRELANQVYVENQKRFEISALSEFDVISAKAGVANRESDILIAERLVKDAENNLRALLSDEATPALLDQPLKLSAPVPPMRVEVNAAADFPKALAGRPDYQSASLAIERGELNLKYQSNQMLPSLDLVGTYGQGGAGRDFSSSRRQVTGGDYPAYSAGVVVSVPLTFTAERARKRAAKLELQQASLYLRALEQSIVVSVGNASGYVDTAWKRVEAAATARALSEQTLDGELKRLRAGTGTTYFVLRQQEILSADEVREARAHADYRNALAEYDRQTARTLERYHVELQ